MGKILLISHNRFFSPNTSGCYGLTIIVHAAIRQKKRNSTILKIEYFTITEVPILKEKYFTQDLSIGNV